VRKRKRKTAKRITKSAAGRGRQTFRRQGESEDFSGSFPQLDEEEAGEMPAGAHLEKRTSKKGNLIKKRTKRTNPKRSSRATTVIMVLFRGREGPKKRRPKKTHQDGGGGSDWESSSSWNAWPRVSKCQY